ncbi:hypothetical protein CDAR_497381 [Caerostris darwini]|uniref:Uncharacterized protein n=1 Tax=Caerostris darwini TaxID=1538125 RepID=A0AAV4S3Q5_9ARAC|nr:hypothetical protein CDAR_497381 [Caerostris darwini]
MPSVPAVTQRKAWIVKIKIDLFTLVLSPPPPPKTRGGVRQKINTTSSSSSPLSPLQKLKGGDEKSLNNVLAANGWGGLESTGSHNLLVSDVGKRLIDLYKFLRSDS